MKLPGLNIPQTGRYHAKNLPKLDYTQVGDAAAGLASQVAGFLDADTDITSATGEAAKELARLRAKLEDNHTLPVEAIPEGVEYDNIKVVQDEAGEEIEVEIPTVFTHDVANQMWEMQSQSIIDRHASTITSKEARTKFINEMQERYVVPGTLAISGKAASSKISHNWAVAEVAIDEILSSGGPSRQREEQAYEILARQSLLGVNPQLIEQKRATIGPRIDYIDATNELKSATSIDEIDQIEAGIWEGENRMSPNARNELSVEADKRRGDFNKLESERIVRNEEEMTVLLLDGKLTKSMVSGALANRDISQEVARIFMNSLDAGGTTAKASNPFVLSHWRKQILGLPYVAHTAKDRQNGITVTQKANLMKRAIRLSAMGLDMSGNPLPTGATISGEDSFKLMKDIDDTVKRYTETSAYNDVWEQIRYFTRAADPLTGALSGNQAQVDSAIAFKRALDNYMNQYGIDADPNEFFRTNKEFFDPANMEDGIHQAFWDDFPEVRQFMTKEPGEPLKFGRREQERFIQWLRRAVSSQEITEDEANEMASYFMMYYRGQGIAPVDTTTYEGPLYEDGR